MLEEIYYKSLNNEITPNIALELVNSANQFELFDTADQLRKTIVGDKVTYVVNKAIDACFKPTNSSKLSEFDYK